MSDVDILNQLYVLANDAKLDQLREDIMCVIDWAEQVLRPEIWDKGRVLQPMEAQKEIEEGVISDHDLIKDNLRISSLLADNIITKIIK